MDTTLVGQEPDVLERELSVAEQAVCEILGCLPIIHEKFIRSYERSEGSIFTQLQGKAMALIASNGALPMYDIAERMDMSKQQLTRFIDTLVQRGMLHRYNRENDRRTIYIELTPIGRNKLDEYNRGTLVRHLDTIKELSPQEQEELFAAARHFRRLLERYW